MIEAEQLKYKLNSFQEPLEDLSGSLALEAKKERIDQLELNMEEPGFWDNVEESQNVMKEVKSLKGVVEEYDDLKTKYEDIETLIDMAEEDEDADLIEEATALMDEFEKTYEGIVYHAVEDSFGMLSLLYVSKNEEDWPFERPEGKYLYAMVYNFDKEKLKNGEYDIEFEEFGTIIVKSLGGAIVRVE